MGKKVLVVDDSSIMRKMIRQTIIENNHTVIGEAKNGRDAVEMYKNLKPDVVTMDITMREMDGFSAAKEILEFDPEAKIIILSNLDEKKYSQEAKAVGALAYITKHHAKDIVNVLDKL